MNNANDFRSMQNVAFKKELNERQKKVQTVTQIVALGTKVRVTNFKAQATDNMAMMQDAIDTLSGLGKYTGELRPITRDAEDIKRIDATEAAANRYSENMANISRQPMPWTKRKVKWPPRQPHIWKIVALFWIAKTKPCAKSFTGKAPIWKNGSKKSPGLMKS